MITTGKEPLSNMEDFYSRMDTGMSNHGWPTYARLKILREANFIDLIHNVSISHLIQEDCVSLGALSSRYDHATAMGIFYDVVYGTAPKGSEWRIHSFQVRSKELIFRMVPCFNSSDMIEPHFSLDHLQGQILQFGLEVGYPRWQFWRLGRVVNIVCDMKGLPESLRIAVTVSDDFSVRCRIHNVRSCFVVKITRIDKTVGRDNNETYIDQQLNCYFYNDIQ